MAQYIDKNALVAEIERLWNEYKNNDEDNKLTWFVAKLENFIDTIEVKEVDYRPIDKDFERDAVNFCFDNALNTTPRIAKTIAKHFFELGLKAQKGE